MHGIADEKEVASLNTWLKNSTKNYEYYERLCKNYNSDKLELGAEDLKKSWNKIKPQKTFFNKLSVKRAVQYAAAVLLPLFFAAGVMLLTDTPSQTGKTTHKIRPGASKAILKLSDGQLIELNANKTQVIKDNEGGVLGIDSIDLLKYNQKNEEAAITSFNTIQIPRGGNYQLVLSDGTKVWLNSESSLTYPVSFAGNSREVFLTGEAFFDVKSDQTAPFIVKTSITDIKVYGTQFNVMGYENDDVIETTLVKGNIAVLVKGQETLINPGQQARINKNSKKMFVNEVNVDLYTAWKDGIFRFEQMTLQQMAYKLERWYDVKFFFANEDVKGKRFTGAVRRETNFEFFIDLIEETTKVKIDINDKTVLVKALY